MSSTPPRYAALQGTTNIRAFLRRDLPISQCHLTCPPEGLSFITRVCGSGFHILRLQFGQARRARRPHLKRFQFMLDRQYPATPSALSGHWRYPCFNKNWKRSSSSVRRACAGVWFRRDECGLTLLSSYRQSASFRRASFSLSNISWFKNASRRLPLNDSMKAFCCGLPGSI